MTDSSSASLFKICQEPCSAPVSKRISSFLRILVTVRFRCLCLSMFERTERIASPSFYMIPREQQFAEKLHAYTLPRPGAVNSRVRDLVDMILLIQSRTLKSDNVREAVRITFNRRKTHLLPSALPPMFCYLKPYFNDPNKSYFRQLADGEL
jgi:Nucleotidyl transferase AbiEii toxin, Type IV TA system